MPVIDKPLHELRNYQGINPRPADFDNYWDEALAELDSVDARPELVPNPMLSTRFCVGGARIYAKYQRPKSKGKHPAVLFFHGYSGNSGNWSDRLGYVAEGFCTAGMDCRGQGGRSQDVGGSLGTTLRGHIVRGLGDPDPHKLLYRSIFLDTVQLARVVMSFDEVDPTRLGATGASQGGALTLACAALEPRIRRAMPVYPFLCDYKRVWDMDLAKDAYAELRDYFRLFDPLHEREHDIFERLGYIDCQHLAPRIQADLCMLTGLMDTVCPPSTQFAAYNKVKSPKDMIIYPDFAHETLPHGSDHIFNFMMPLRDA
jgi:cephalosporin-C deacetylase